MPVLSSFNVKAFPGQRHSMKQAGISFIRKEIVDDTTTTNTKSN